MLGHLDRDDNFVGMTITLKVPKGYRKESTIKVSCCQGTAIFLCLSLLYLAIMVSSIYVGFWISLHEEDDYALVIISPMDNVSSYPTSVLPLNVASLGCQDGIDPPPFPDPVIGAIGAIMGKRLRICGGYVAADNETLNICRTLDRNRWVHDEGGFARMTTARAFAADIRIAGVGWWLTGGLGHSQFPLDSSEIMAEQSSREDYFEGGPRLPVTVARHCLARAPGGDRRVLLSGGQTLDQQFSDAVWLYDWEREDRWHPRPRLNVGRRGHACFSDHDGSIYVAGGATAAYPDGSASVEVLRSGARAWRSLAALPTRLLGAVAFHWHGSPTLAGGSNESSVLLKWNDNTWEETDKKLKHAVQNPVVVAVKMSWVC